VEDDGVFLDMGNSSKAQVLGKKSVRLEFTYGKFFTLNDVYHVPNIKESCVG